MHPHQDRRGADQGQHRHQEAAEGFADEFVQGVQVGHQVGGDRTAAQAFVLTQGDTLETFDQAHADAVHDVLGQARKQPRLHHVEHQRAAAQGQGDQEHQADIASGFLPTQGQRVVHHLEGGIAMAQ